MDKFSNDVISADVAEAIINFNLLPKKSRRQYVETYNEFKSWLTLKKYFVKRSYFGISKCAIKEFGSYNIMGSLFPAKSHFEYL